MAEQKISDVTYLGKCNFRGNQRVFGIKQKDRRQHMYVIGKTGVGKTALLKNMALQDIRAGRGIGIIDPHGEFVEEVLSQVPADRTNDVVYFNPVDSDYPIGFNVLEVPDLKYKHLIVSDLMGIFTKIWANVWSARMEYIMQNCILALLDTPGTTLLGIPRLLVDKDYRQKILVNVKDPVVKSFWVHEFETWRDQFRNEAIVPIQNKVGQFLNTSFIRNIVGQTKSTLNIPQIMNEGKVLLVNVSKGRIGEDNSALLGAMIITKIQLAAMERVRIPEEDRSDFYLFVDEFQNFATDSFAAILSEARKYRLNLIIAHQYVGQLVTDVSTKVRDAVFGNVGTMITFRVGATDAEFLEMEFTPEFLPDDLINLPNHNIYTKLMVDGVTSRPFSAVTLPPLEFEQDPFLKEKIINVSRERYGTPIQEVEEKISRWSGVIAGEGGGTESVGAMHETTCWNCGKTATVPFKPDGRRPVYCLPCMKQIEEGKLIPLPERMPQVGRARFAPTLGDLGIEFETAAGVQKRQAPFSPVYPVRTPPTPARLPPLARLAPGGADSPRFAGEAGATAKRAGGKDRDSRWERSAFIDQARGARSNGVYPRTEKTPASSPRFAGQTSRPEASGVPRINSTQNPRSLSRSEGVYSRNERGNPPPQRYPEERKSLDSEIYPKRQEVKTRPQSLPRLFTKPVVKIPEDARPISLSVLKPKETRSSTESDEVASPVSKKDKVVPRATVNLSELKKVLEESLKESKPETSAVEKVDKNEQVVKPGETVKF